MTDVLERWQALLGVAQVELAHARAGRWEEAAATAADRDELTDGLPGVPPAEARALIEALLDVGAEVLELASAARASTADELRRLHRGRYALHGYAAEGDAAADGARSLDQAG